MPNSEIFPLHSSISNEAVHLVSGEDRLAGANDPDDSLDDYIAQRRQWLGRAADITHPNFGEPNPEEEIFKIVYKIRKSAKKVEFKDSGHITRGFEVDELVYDFAGELVPNKTTIR